MKHIAYFQNWGLGDLVMTLPALVELRRAHPNARLTLIVRGGAQAAFLKGTDLVDQIIAMPPRRDKPALLKFFLGLRREGFDAAVIGTRISPVLPALLRLLTGVRTIIGDGNSKGFLYTQQTPIVEGVHRVDRMRDVIGNWTKAPLGDIAFPVPTTSAGEAEADDLLTSVGLTDQAYLVMHAGSSVAAGTDKRVPPDVARGIIAGVRKATDKTPMLLMFGPDELDLVDSFGPYGDGVHALTGMSLEATKIILKRAHGFIGTDSGLGHVAAAFGTPTITLAGPTKPDETRPWGPKGAVVSHVPQLACQPCHGTPLYGNCPYGIKCMVDLPQQAVIDHVAGW